MTHLQRVALLSALRRAFCGKWFDVCGVEAACKLASVPVYQATIEWYTLQALHCVNFDTMDTQAKLELFELVATLLGVDVNADRAFLQQVSAMHYQPQLTAN